MEKEWREEETEKKGREEETEKEWREEETEKEWREEETEKEGEGREEETQKEWREEETQKQGEGREEETEKEEEGRKKEYHNRVQIGQEKQRKREKCLSWVDGDGVKEKRSREVEEKSSRGKRFKWYL